MSMILSLFASTLITAAVPAANGFDRFVGNWYCAGHFVRSGKPLAASITATLDAGTGALVVRHDDAAGGTYRSLEVWSRSVDGSGMRASISDSSGMRWSQSAGWKGGHLTWESTASPVATEQFSYTFNQASDMQIDWSVARVGRSLVLGDTLLCHQNHAS